MTATALFCLFATQVWAASTEETPTPSINISRAMDDVRSMLQNEKYSNAVKWLKQIVEQEPANADAWNLMGFAERKRGQLKKAAKAYNKALQLNPDHKGALEYQGELFIVQERRGMAEANRDRLIALCPDGCEELTDLEAALAGGEGKSSDW